MMFRQSHYNQVEKLKEKGDIQSEQVRIAMLRIQGLGFSDSVLKDTAAILEIMEHVVKNGSRVLFLSDMYPRYTMLCTAVMVGDKGRVTIVHKSESYIDWFCDNTPAFVADRIRNILTKDMAEHVSRRKYDFIMGSLHLPVPDNLMDRLKKNGIMMVADVKASEIVIPGKHPRFKDTKILLQDPFFFLGFRKETPELLDVLGQSHEREKEARNKSVGKAARRSQQPSTSATTSSQSSKRAKPVSRSLKTVTPVSQPSTTTIPVTQPSTTTTVSRPSTTTPVTQPLTTTTSVSQPSTTIAVTQLSTTAPVTQPSTPAPVTQPSTTTPVSRPSTTTTPVSRPSTTTTPVTQSSTTIPVTQPSTTAPESTQFASKIKNS